MQRIPSRPNPQRRRSRGIGAGRRGGAGNREATAPGGETGAVLERVRLYGQKPKSRRPKLSKANRVQLAKIRQWGRTQKPRVKFYVGWETELEQVPVCFAVFRGEECGLQIRGQWWGNLRDFVIRTRGLTA